MSAEIAIDARRLSKKFCPGFRRSLLYAVEDIALSLLPGRPRRDRLRKGEFWALRYVGFTLPRGEALAVIGHNGAGKSTLLKILYGLLNADGGSVMVSGNVVALIELGTGMNPLQTGRENVVLLGLLHGLSRREAAAIVPAVLEFAELEHFADVEVQAYSTGMRARLAFAIAIMARPAILLLDEVLAVGDVPFQRKCISYLQGFVARGGTLVLVSHAVHQLQAVCARAILLDEGKLVAAGQTPQVVRQYLELSANRLAQPGGHANPDAALSLDGIELVHASGKIARCGEGAVLRLRFTAREPLTAYCGATIWTPDGATCITSSFDTLASPIEPGSATIECHIPSLPLVPGRYLVRPVVADSVAYAPIAFGGAASGGVLIKIDGDADIFTNGQLQLGQLVAMDGVWNSQPENAGKPRTAAGG